MPNIVLFGPPGAGKGTQSDNLAKDLDLYKISTGDLLRKEVKKKSVLGNKIKSMLDQGIFVSDNVINDLIESILSNKNYSNRLIFDGYPRNLNQAKYLDMLIKKYSQKIFCTLNLKVNQDVTIKRIIGRQICSVCGLIFNEFSNPSTKKTHGCDTKFLQKRSDDNEKTAINRFDIYIKETLPVLNYYKNQNLLYEIDGTSNIYDKICAIIATLET
jgi:adenylate kinase